MSVEFIAHPVREGDAFEIRCDGKRVLVDGGRDPEETLKLVMEMNPQKAEGNADIKLDAVICTHNDRDHACGLQLLVQLGLTKELWVPATWIAAVHFAIDAHSRKGSWFQLDGDLVDDLAAEEFDSPGDLGYCDGSEPELSTDVVLGLPVLVDPGDLARGIVAPTTTGGRTWPLRARVHSNLEALANIINLVKAALAAGVEVKTLAFADRTTDEQLAGLPELRAHNANHGKRINRQRATMRDVVALTIVNRQALTFRFEHSSGARVFFSSDSDLDYTSGQRVALADQTLVTVPHHGSKDNDKAYRPLEAGERPRVWARSDTLRGTGKARPTTLYLGLPDPKFCTRCKGDPFNRAQRIHLTWEGSRWQSTANTEPCHCVA